MSRSPIFRKLRPDAVARVVKACAVPLLSALTMYTFYGLFWCAQRGMAQPLSMSRADILLGAKLSVILPQMTLLALFWFFYRRFFRAARSFSLLQAILAAFFTVSFSIGFSQMATGGETLMTPLRTADTLVWTWCFFYAFLELAGHAMDGFGHDRLTETAVDPSARRFGAAAFVLIVLCWLPHLISQFPGSVSRDTGTQLLQFWGILPLSNNSPFADTLVFGSLFGLGKWVFGSDNAGVFVYVLFQTALMASAFAYCAGTVLHLTRSRKAAWILAAFFGLNPVFGSAAQVMLKDSLHLGLMTFFIAKLLRIVYAGELRKRDIVPFFLLTLVTALSRKAALPYVIAAAAAMCLVVAGTGRKRILAGSAACVVLFLLVENVLYPVLGVNAAPTKELMSLPLQSMCYITTLHHDQMTPEELAQVEEIVAVEDILRDFDPNISDPMKRCLKADMDGDGSSKCLALAAKLALKYPKDAVTGFLKGCWKYFFPVSSGANYYISYIRDFPEAEVNIHYTNPDGRDRWWYLMLVCDNLPFVKPFLGPGLYTWLFLFAALRALRLREKRLLPVLVCAAVLTVGLLFTPVNGECRYAFPLYMMAPTLLMMVGGNARQPILEDERHAESKPITGKRSKRKARKG